MIDITRVDRLPVYTDRYNDTHTFTDSCYVAYCATEAMCNEAGLCGVCSCPDITCYSN